MENLNAETVKKALECCIGDDDCNRCPYWEGVDVNCFDNVKSDALALINSQEQRIKELTEERKDFEIRALRAENESAKYKDRWETSRKDFERLADEYESLKDSNEHLAVFLDEAKAENERLRGILLQFTDIVHKWGNKNGYDTTEISLVSITYEANKIKSQIEADTVRKMQEEVKARCRELFSGFDVCMIVDQIAKEMVEGEK